MLMPSTFAPVDVLSDHFMAVLRYPNQYELMYSLGRFQEYYENATLKGTVFTRAQLESLAPTYYTSWSGCNFPSEVVKTVGAWPDLDEHERAALAAMPADTYIVGIHLEHKNPAGVLAHERAHALWAAREDYRDLVTEMLDHHYTQIARDEMRAALLAAGYHPSVLLDEIQAYHQHGWAKMLGGVAPMCPEFKLAQGSFIAQIYREVRSVPVTI
jgi:hypothetical protein